MNHSPSNDELLDNLRRIAQEIQRPIRTSDITRLAKWSMSLYYKRFGSLSKALCFAGLEFVYPKPRLQPSAKVSVQCAYPPCSKAMYRWPSEIKSRKRLYCCREHANLHQHETQTGEQNGFYRHKHTEATRAKIGQHNSQLRRTPEQLVRMSRASKAKWQNPEFASRRIAQLRIQNASPEKRFQHSLRMRGKNNPHYGHPPAESSGRCKWFVYTSRMGEFVKVQGKMELRMAKILDKLGVSWTSHKALGFFHYRLPDGCERTYWPDFYVKDFGYYIEVKGYFDPIAQEKMRLVREQNPQATFVIINKRLIEIFEKLAMKGTAPIQLMLDLTGAGITLRPNNP